MVNKYPRDWRQGSGLATARNRGGEAELTSDLDIYRTAKLLVDEHGEEASI